MPDSSNREHPLVALRSEIPAVPDGVEAVIAQNGIIAGTAFFPGGWGLWGTRDGSPLPQMPTGGIMIVGQDFDSETGFARSLGKGFEVEVHADDSYDAKRSPTWRALLPFLCSRHADLRECFFTNAFMGLRKGTANTGAFPGASNERYSASCQRFFLDQIRVQQPRLILSLGKWVPPFLARLSPQLTAWDGVASFPDLDAAGPVAINVRFDGTAPPCCVVALTHPSYRALNAKKRMYCGEEGETAESDMLKDGLNLSVGGTAMAIRAAQLRCIERNFLTLIRARAREGGLDEPAHLSALDVAMLGEAEPRWFPIMGMYGGFAYRLTERGSELQLTAESWSRVVSGSGMRHVITPTRVVLEAQGFV